MPSHLTTKLQHGSALTETDRHALERLIGPAIQIGVREMIVNEGEPCDVIRVLLSGWACRFKLVSGLSRQIVAFMVPGDHSALHSSFGDCTTYGISALTSCQVAEIDGVELAALLRTAPNLERAFRWSSIANEAVLHEWMANIGCRPAERRMAHLLCELLDRLRAVDLASAHSFRLPLTQATLGDALGLSPAHVNRSLQALRARGLVFFEDGRVEVDDIQRLRKFAGFSSSYLNFRAADADLSDRLSVA